MSTGSLKTLTKNVTNVAAGFSGFATASSKNLATYKKIKDRQWNHGPQSIKDQAEVYDTNYWKRHLCQDKNMWVDKELCNEVSRKELGEFMTYKADMWKMAHCVAPAFLLGGYGLPFIGAWLANDTWVPSTFATTEAGKKEWREAQDLQRYKHAPAMLTQYKWWLEFHAKIPDAFAASWEEIFEKNDVRRDAVKCANHARMYESFQPFYLIKRQQARAIGRCMGMPTYPTFGKINLQARIKDTWDMAWNEDYMVITQKLTATMSDEELYDYAWRRYLAPYDKELSREQLLERVGDYHAFLGDSFVEDGKAPNIFTTITFCMGYYNEPAFLDMDIAELETNDFDNLANMPKDAFLQRLEFENGPLRDQVEAHVTLLEAKKAKKLEA